jgi:hypothetical protein
MAFGPIMELVKQTNWPPKAMAASEEPHVLKKPT